MNTPSPLIPQGTLISHQGKSHIRIAVFTILAIHIVLLGALLLQGCKRTTEPPPPEPSAALTNTLSQWELPPPPLPDLVTVTSRGPVLPPATPPSFPPDIASEPPPPVPSTPSIPEPPAPPPEPTPTPEVTEPPPPTPTGTEHVIARGDTFYDLAKKYGTTTKAIADANPNVDPRRLKPGDKVYIPAPVTAPTADTTRSGSDQTIYTVKSGDTLTRIAKIHGTSVKALRSANNLATDRIQVGDKLVIPKSANP